jgi:hypothetical protein
MVKYAPGSATPRKPLKISFNEGPSSASAGKLIPDPIE